MSVVAARAKDGSIRAFENRCAHRGALIVLDDGGKVAHQFQCVYHAWSYDLGGSLVGVAFEKGVKGKGGMAPGFCKADHGPRKLRTTVLCGLVFATLSDETPPLEEWLGEEVCSRIKRVLSRPIEVLGRFTQAMPNNWKTYAENVRDTYHASLLHTFYGTFRITRLTQAGGVVVSPHGGHHAAFTIEETKDDSSEYRDQGLRSDNANYRLADASMLDGVDEFGDGVKLQMLTVFPTFILQQISNCLAVRQMVPKGPRGMELHWTYFGFKDDTSEMRHRRLKQINLVGPAGFISMEDGCIGDFVHRGVATAPDVLSIVSMGGEDAESQDTRNTETSVRGFWKAYRGIMGV
jgi:anthranilate 1,2-dioxygenase large subunit/terephthalate 1,2-dioxygenase oxygenase component alpha subunit